MKIVRLIDVKGWKQYGKKTRYTIRVKLIKKDDRFCWEFESGIMENWAFSHEWYKEHKHIPCLGERKQNPDHTFPFYETDL